MRSANAAPRSGRQFPDGRQFGSYRVVTRSEVSSMATSTDTRYLAVIRFTAEKAVLEGGRGDIDVM